MLLIASASIALSMAVNLALNPAVATGVVTPGQRVDTSLHPQWAGVMDPDDCVKARALLGGRVAFYNPHWLMVFWSRRWTVQPEGDYAFELPFGVRYSEYFLPPSSNIRLSGIINFRRLIRLLSCFASETCTLLVRVAKDYGDDVIFSGETPVHYAKRPARAFESWFHILKFTNFLLQDVRLHDKPLWGYLTDVVILFVPSSSVISKRWSAGMRSSPEDVSEE
ncbi:MAG: hypothetical protein L6R42_007150 [Xanthoria sp. 1 TBL-2021]|nr:MAG: hypothetical protein L6R42_007150 [Xanthoria sp. 1 TBL-2021]